MSSDQNDSDTNNNMTVTSWFTIIFLGVSPFIVLGTLICLFSFCECNTAGQILIRKRGPIARKRLIDLSIVTKKVKINRDWRMCSCYISTNAWCQSAGTCNREANSTPEITTPNHNIPAMGDSIVRNMARVITRGIPNRFFSECPICLESFLLGESISFAKNTMYCNHVFHTKCIRTWLKTNSSCPCCRHSIIRSEDLHMQCNCLWYIFCSFQRRITLLIKQHRELLSQCRETGEFCINHGLVFPYEEPNLELPYEPRSCELVNMLLSVKETPKVEDISIPMAPLPEQSTQRQKRGRSDRRTTAVEEAPRLMNVIERGNEYESHTENWVESIVLNTSRSVGPQSIDDDRTVASLDQDQVQSFDKDISVIDVEEKRQIRRPGVQNFIPVDTRFSSSRSKDSSVEESRSSNEKSSFRWNG